VTWDTLWLLGWGVLSLALALGWLLAVALWPELYGVGTRDTFKPGTRPKRKK